MLRNSKVSVPPSSSPSMRVTGGGVEAKVGVNEND